MPSINEIATIEYNGRRYLRWEGLLLVPLDFDPNTGVIVAVAPPAGIEGAGGIANIPALVKGDNGLAPVLQEDAEVTELEYDDPTPVTSTWVLVTPGTDTTAPVYKEVKTVRKGTPGETGTTTILTATDFSGTPSPQKVLIVNDDADGVTVQTQKTGDVLWPASITEASNDTTQTLGVVNIPARDSDFRVVVSGGSLVTGDNNGDCVVNLVARLNGETGGTIVGRSLGRSGILQAPHTLFSAPAAGSADEVNRVSAGASATVHLRAERQSGADTFDTAQTYFSVQVVDLL